MNRTELRQILLSSKLLISTSGYQEAMMQCMPLFSANLTPLAYYYNDKPPTYREQASEALSSLIQKYAVSQDVNLTDDFSSEDLPDNTIAYHRIFGIITSSSTWYFSSKQFEHDLIAAENNPAIGCHFLHINSPGGEAWYMDRLSQTMRSLRKPTIVLVEKACASAGYYIACHSPNIFTLTSNDHLGCIGVMSEMYDFTAYYEQLGIKHLTFKASQSNLKNKKYDDARTGHPEQFIREELDPIAVQFITEVRSCRSKLSELQDDDPILRGETYSSLLAIDNGLADGQCSFTEAVAKAHQLSCEYISSSRIQNSVLNNLFN